jgi:hypothetical protein
MKKPPEGGGKKPPEGGFSCERIVRSVAGLVDQLVLAIQGIMARSCAPTTSMLCSAMLRRRAVMLG